jgi:hypothetical protein
MAQENTTKKTEVQKQETPTTTAQVKKNRKENEQAISITCAEFSMNTAEV